MKSPSQAQVNSLPRSIFALLLAALLVMSVSVYAGKVPQSSAQSTCVGSWDNLHWVEGVEFKEEAIPMSGSLLLLNLTGKCQIPLKLAIK